jgi:hypothetical protein
MGRIVPYAWAKFRLRWIEFHQHWMKSAPVERRAESVDGRAQDPP